TLVTADNQVDPTTATVKLKAVFKNEDETLFPNQFVNARLLVDVRQKATIAPAAAIQLSADTTYVYVVVPAAPSAEGAPPADDGGKECEKETGEKGKGEKGKGEKAKPEKDKAKKVEGTVEFREVVVGPSEGDEVVVEKGLGPDEYVVISGVDKLQQGSKVSA